MIPQVTDIYGVDAPTLLLLALACFVLFNLLRRLLAATGLYAWVWHRPLFDLALYFVLLGLSVDLMIGGHP